MRRIGRGRGFTLVEVLVALVVLSVVGFAVTARVGDIANQTFSLERRTVASWVAENRINRLRIEGMTTDEALETGTEREPEEMSGRDWMVEVEVEETVHPLLRRVEVRVFELTGDGEQGPLEQLTAFVGRY